MSLGKSNPDPARHDPAGTFAAPEDVAAHPTLTRERKIEILEQWAYDASESEVATEEGMPGGEPAPLRRILLALESLGVAGDAAGSGPTKQHAPAPGRR